MIEYMVKVIPDCYFSVFGMESEPIETVLRRNFLNINTLKVIAKRNVKGNGVWIPI